jgi:hypothetical protein
MAAPDRPIAKAASADQVVVRPDADDFPVPCQVPGRDSHPSASVDAPEQRQAAPQARRPRDGLQHSALRAAHQAADPPEVARVVAVAKVAGQEPERSALRRHQRAKVWKDATERRVARSASQWGALQVPVLPPRDSRSQQQERPLGLWAPQLPESQLPAPWQEKPQALTVSAQWAQQPVKAPRSRVWAPRAWPMQVPQPAQQQPERTSPARHSASSARPWPQRPSLPCQPLPWPPQRPRPRHLPVA